MSAYTMPVDGRAGFVLLVFGFHKLDFREIDIRMNN